MLHFGVAKELDHTVEKLKKLIPGAKFEKGTQFPKFVYLGFALTKVQTRINIWPTLAWSEEVWKDFIPHSILIPFFPELDSIILTPQELAGIEVSSEGLSSPFVEKKRGRKEAQHKERREPEPIITFKDKALIEETTKILLDDEAKLKQMAKYFSSILIDNWYKWLLEREIDSHYVVFMISVANTSN